MINSKDSSLKDAETGIARNSMMLMLISIVGFPLNLLAQATIAAHYGTSSALDAYWVAFSIVGYIPNIYSISIVDPFVSLVMKTASVDEKNRLMNAVFTSTICGGVLIMIGIFFGLRFLIPVIAPGFDLDQVRLTNSILFLLLPYTLLCCLAFLFIGGLATAKLFVAPRIVMLITPTVTFLLVTIFAAHWGINALTSATVLAVAFQLALLVPMLNNAQYKLKFTKRLYKSILGGLARLGFPMFLAGVLSGAYVFADRAAASKIGEGAISTIGYGDFLNSKIAALLIAPLSTVAFPYISEVWNSPKFGDRLAYGIKIMMLLIVPTAIFTCVFSAPIVELLFQRGKFNPDDVRNVSVVLIVFMFGLPAYAVQMIAMRALIAQGITWIFIVGGTVALALKIMLNDMLAAHWGPAGIVSLTSITGWMGVTASIFLLRRVMHNRSKFLATLLRDAASIFALSLLSMGASWLVWFFLGRLIHSQVMWILAIKLCGAGIMLIMGVILLAEITGIMNFRRFLRSRGVS